MTQVLAPVSQWFGMSALYAGPGFIWPQCQWFRMSALYAGPGFIWPQCHSGSECLLCTQAQALFGLSVSGSECLLCTQAQALFGPSVTVVRNVCSVRRPRLYLAPVSQWFGMSALYAGPGFIWPQCHSGSECLLCTQAQALFGLSVTVVQNVCSVRRPIYLASVSQWFRMSALYAGPGFIWPQCHSGSECLLCTQAQALFGQCHSGSEVCSVQAQALFGPSVTVVRNVCSVRRPRLYLASVSQWFRMSALYAGPGFIWPQCHSGSECLLCTQAQALFGPSVTVVQNVCSVRRPRLYLASVSQWFRMSALYAGPGFIWPQCHSGSDVCSVRRPRLYLASVSQWFRMSALYAGPGFIWPQCHSGSECLLCTQAQALFGPSVTVVQNVCSVRRPRLYLASVSQWFRMSALYAGPGFIWPQCHSGSECLLCTQAQALFGLSVTVVQNVCSVRRPRLYLASVSQWFRMSALYAGPGFIWPQCHSGSECLLCTQAQALFGPSVTVVWNVCSVRRPRLYLAPVSQWFGMSALYAGPGFIWPQCHSGSECLLCTQAQALFGPSVTVVQNVCSVRRPRLYLASVSQWFRMSALYAGPGFIWPQCHSGSECLLCTQAQALFGPSVTVVQNVCSVRRPRLYLASVSQWFRMSALYAGPGFIWPQCHSGSECLLCTQAQALFGLSVTVVQNVCSVRRPRLYLAPVSQWFRMSALYAGPGFIWPQCHSGSECLLCTQAQALFGLSVTVVQNVCSVRRPRLYLASVSQWFRMSALYAGPGFIWPQCHSGSECLLCTQAQAWPQCTVAECLLCTQAQALFGLSVTVVQNVCSVRRPRLIWPQCHSGSECLLCTQAQALFGPVSQWFRMSALYAGPGFIWPQCHSGSECLLCTQAQALFGLSVTVVQNVCSVRRPRLYLAPVSQWFRMSALYAGPGFIWPQCHSGSECLLCTQAQALFGPSVTVVQNVCSVRRPRLYLAPVSQWFRMSALYAGPGFIWPQCHSGSECLLCTQAQALFGLSVTVVRNVCSVRRPRLYLAPVSQWFRMSALYAGPGFIWPQCHSGSECLLCTQAQALFGLSVTVVRNVCSVRRPRLYLASVSQWFGMSALYAGPGFIWPQCHSGSECLLCTQAQAWPQCHSGSECLLCTQAQALFGLSVTVVQNVCSVRRPRLYLALFGLSVTVVQDVCSVRRPRLYLASVSQWFRMSALYAGPGFIWPQCHSGSECLLCTQAQALFGLSVTVVQNVCSVRRPRLYLASVSQWFRMSALYAGPGFIWPQCHSGSECLLCTQAQALFGQCHSGSECLLCTQAQALFGPSVTVVQNVCSVRRPRLYLASVSQWFRMSALYAGPGFIWPQCHSGSECLLCTQAQALFGLSVTVVQNVCSVRRPRLYLASVSQWFRMSALYAGPGFIWPQCHSGSECLLCTQAQALFGLSVTVVQNVCSVRRPRLYLASVSVVQNVCSVRRPRLYLAPVSQWFGMSALYAGPGFIWPQCHSGSECLLCTQAQLYLASVSQWFRMSALYAGPGFIWPQCHSGSECLLCTQAQALFGLSVTVVQNVCSVHRPRLYLAPVSQWFRMSALYAGPGFIWPQCHSGSECLLCTQAQALFGPSVTVVQNVCSVRRPRLYLAPVSQWFRMSALYAGPGFIWPQCHSGSECQLCTQAQALFGLSVTVVRNVCSVRRPRLYLASVSQWFGMSALYAGPGFIWPQCHSGSECLLCTQAQALFGPSVTVVRNVCSVRRPRLYLAPVSQWFRMSALYAGPGFIWPQCHSGSECLLCTQAQALFGVSVTVVWNVCSVRRPRLYLASVSQWFRMSALYAGPGFIWPQCHSGSECLLCTQAQALFGLSVTVVQNVCSVRRPRLYLAPVSQWFGMSALYAGPGFIWPQCHSGSECLLCTQAQAYLAPVSQWFRMSALYAGPGFIWPQCHSGSECLLCTQAQALFGPSVSGSECLLCTQAQALFGPSVTVVRNVCSVRRPRLYLASVSQWFGMSALYAGPGFIWPQCHSGSECLLCTQAQALFGLSVTVVQNVCSVRRPRLYLAPVSQWFGMSALYAGPGFIWPQCQWFRMSALYAGPGFIWPQCHSGSECLLCTQAQALFGLSVTVVQNVCSVRRPRLYLAPVSQWFRMSALYAGPGFIWPQCHSGSECLLCTQAQALFGPSVTVVQNVCSVRRPRLYLASVSLWFGMSALYAGPGFIWPQCHSGSECLLCTQAQALFGPSVTVVQNVCSVRRPRLYLASVSQWFGMSALYAGPGFIWPQCHSGSECLLCTQAQALFGLSVTVVRNVCSVRRPRLYLAPVSQWFGMSALYAGPASVSQWFGMSALYAGPGFISYNSLVCSPSNLAFYFGYIPNLTSHWLFFV